MPNQSDEIVGKKGQSLKYLTHWPAVNIKFEDIIYTVENGSASKCV
jgi:hypothetical protein